MAEEKPRKIIIEREYIVPLRREWLKVAEFKRANKAVKALKQFLVQHMKVYDRDLRKIRVDILLNNEIRFRGMRKPPASIRVKAIKYEDGFVDAKLVDIPKHIEFQLAREARRQVEALNKGKVEEKKDAAEEIKKEQEAEKKEGKVNEKAREIKEKEESSKEAELKIEKESAKLAKHTTESHQKAPVIQRKSLKK
jgi:large subunit ribosomal protein L31e